MKALRYYGKEDVRLEDIEEQAMGPGMVKVKPAWTGICGSDLHLYLDGAFPPAPTLETAHPLSGEKLPVTFGHEFSGTVEEIGEGVTGLEVGDSVAIEPYMVCGECPPCREGRYNLCWVMGFIGISGRGGGLSEHIVVESRWVHPVGDMPLDQAALIEPLSVAVHAVRLSGAKAGDVALVGGAGPIGLLTAAALKAIGATVVISEVSAARKEKAQATGVADHILDPTQGDVVAQVKELTLGAGADVTFDCAGVKVVFDTLAAAVKQGGVVQVVALYSGPIEMDMSTIVMRELQVHGSLGYAGDHPEAIRLVREGKVDLAPFITARIGVADYVEKGIDVLHHHNETAVKIIVEM